MEWSSSARVRISLYMSSPMVLIGCEGKNTRPRKRATTGGKSPRTEALAWQYRQRTVQELRRGGRNMYGGHTATDEEF